MTRVMYRFGSVSVDVDSVEVRVNGERRPTEPQVIGVLTYLIEQRHRVVTKDELLDQVWGTQFVSDSAVTSRIESVRHAIGDTGRSQSMIRTVHGRGYRFIADLDAGPGEADPLTSAASVGEPDADSMVRTPDDGWPLIGRDEEHQRTISAARGRKSGGMPLAGPTGLGKTRLASPTAR